MTAARCGSIWRVHDLSHDLAHHGDDDLIPGTVDLAVNVRGPAPQWLRDRIAAADLTGYPDQTQARAAVASRHGRPPAEVLLTAGAAEAFVLLARALRPAHAVVVHPQFTEPELALRTAGHPVTRVVLDWPYRLDPEAVPDGADLVVIGNPTNPTSVSHPAETLRRLARPGRTLVVDEAFADCVPGEPDSLAGDRTVPGLVVIRSLTKTWGLAGLRAGYVLADPGTVADLAAHQPQWGVSTPALVACEACSDPVAVGQAAVWARELAEQRGYLVELLGSVSGIEVVPDPAASFVLISTGMPDIRQRLADRGFAVRRGESFPGLAPGWVRVAVRDRATSESFVRALAGTLDADRAVSAADQERR